MTDDWPPRRPSTWQRVPGGWRLAGAALLLLMVFAAIGLGTTSHPSGDGQAHRGLFRLEATVVTIALGWVAIVALGLAVWALTMKGGEPQQRPLRQRIGWVRGVIILSALIAVAYIIAGIIQQHRNVNATRSGGGSGGGQEPARPRGSGAVDPKVAVIGLLVALSLTVLALIAVGWWERKRRRLAVQRGEIPDDAVALAEAIDAAIEAAIDDLETEDDPRRAVIAAYARMERALHQHGIPRRHWEAPTEYLERVLREIGGQAGPVHRLTELFSIAKFSAHAVDERMRDDAIGALRELRAGLVTPA